MGQSIQTARAALFDACHDDVYDQVQDAAGAPVSVVYGFPGSYQAQTIVAVGISTTQPVSKPTMTTNRSREKQCTVTVTISVFRGGASDVAQQPAADDCDDMISLLESYFQTSPNERLGGACRDAWVSSIDGPTLAPSYADKRITGYTATAVATVTIIVRY